eukprot:Hpha_TRINITY_DN15603_c0_g1::TRINITY_DN15603_c0_g1_i1::g.98502::m.98502
MERTSLTGHHGGTWLWWCRGNDQSVIKTLKVFGLNSQTLTPLVYFVLMLEMKLKVIQKRASTEARQERQSERIGGRKWGRGEKRKTVDMNLPAHLVLSLPPPPSP